MRLIGLVCPGTRHRVVPLKKVDVDVSINDFIANVVSTLEYFNDENEAIEAQFVFPMDDDSAVYHFQVEIDGRTIIGECQEKKQAEETYNEALSQGQGAFFMSEADHTGDTFRIQVGNLSSKKKAIVKFSYVVKLKVSSDGAAEFYLPEVLNPRYNPVKEEGGVHVKTRPTFSAPESIPYKLNFKATIIGSKMIQNIKSEHVPIKWDRDETGAVKVSLSKKFKFDSDIRLSVYYDNPHKPSVTIIKGNKETDGIMKQDIVMLHYFPEIDKSKMASNVEFIFIVDRSGSMRGKNMQHAKGTLLLFLQSLPVGCCFNIISFGSTYEVLFPEASKEYNEKSLTKAKELHSEMDANMGGTEILRPLQHMYNNMKMKEGFCRQVFVLTDGGVSNTRNVIALVEEHAHDTRVFAFGIGQGASTALVKGIARVGKGRAEFVTESDRLQSKVVSSLRLAMQPSIVNVKVDWKVPEGINVVNIPEQIPFVFSGTHTVSYGIIQGECPENIQLTGKLTAKCGDRDINESLIFQLQDAIEDKEYPIHRLAAKEQIKILEDKDSSSDPGTGKQNEELKNKILLLSLSTNIVSKYTAFVGVDKETHEVRCHKVDIPVASDMAFPLCGSSLNRHSVKFMKIKRKSNVGLSAMAASSAAVPSGPPTFSGSMSFLGASLAHPPPPHVRAMPLFGPPVKVPPPPPGSAPPPPRQMGNRSVPRGKAAGSQNRKRTKVFEQESEIVLTSFEPIIDLQNFDGSWKLTDSLATVLNKEVETLKSLDIQDESVLATVVAIVWLELNHSDKSDEWNILIAKSMLWLSKNNKEGKTVKELKSIAKSIFN